MSIERGDEAYAKAMEEIDKKADMNKSSINELLSGVIDYGEEFTITKAGKDVAVIIPIEQYIELKTAATKYGANEGFNVGDSVEAIEDRAPGMSPLGTPPVIHKGDRFTIEDINEWGSLNFGTDDYWYPGSFKKVEELAAVVAKHEKGSEA